MEDTKEAVVEGLSHQCFSCLGQPRLRSQDLQFGQQELLSLACTYLDFLLVALHQAVVTEDPSVAWGCSIMELVA